MTSGLQGPFSATSLGTNENTSTLHLAPCHLHESNTHPQENRVTSELPQSYLACDNYDYCPRFAVESIYDGTYTPYGRYLEQKATFDEQQFSLKRGEDGEGVTETTLAAFCCCSNKSTEIVFRAS